MEMFGSMLPLVIMFAILYLLIIRPQMKKQKDHQNMLKELKKGEKVVTVGGLIGKVTSVSNDTNVIKVKISDGVEVSVEKSAVARKMD